MNKEIIKIIDNQKMVSDTILSSNKKQLFESCRDGNNKILIL